MTGDPPIGTEDAFPKDDPDETPEERRVRLTQTRMASPTGAIPGAAPMGAGTRADAVVRREGGVRDFSHAEEGDQAGAYQIEDYPGQDDPEANGAPRNDPTGDSPADIVTRGINDFVRAVDDPDDDDPRADRHRRP